MLHQLLSTSLLRICSLHELSQWFDYTEHHAAFALRHAGLAVWSFHLILHQAKSHAHCWTLPPESQLEPQTDKRKAKHQPTGSHIRRTRQLRTTNKRLCTKNVSARILRSYFMNSFGSYFEYLYEYAKKFANFGIQQYNKSTTNLGAHNSNRFTCNVRSTHAEVSSVYVRSPWSGGAFHVERHAGPALPVRTAGLQFRRGARLQYDE